MLNVMADIERAEGSTGLSGAAVRGVPAPVRSGRGTLRDQALCADRRRVRLLDPWGRHGRGAQVGKRLLPQGL